MLTQSYRIENDREFAAALDKAAEKVSDLKVAFKLIQDDWIKATRASFILKGSGKYPPLSPAYAARKAITHPGAPILVRSGRLRDSLITRSGTVDSIRHVGKLTMILGTKVPYGIYHQQGGQKIPMRKFLFLDPEGRTNATTSPKVQRWINIIEAEVRRQLSKV